MFEYDKFVAIVGKENVLINEFDLISYSRDRLPIDPLIKFEYIPDFVIVPKTSRHVLEIIKLANELKLPVIPRGAATGYSGGVTGLYWGSIELFSGCGWHRSLPQYCS